MNMTLGEIIKNARKKKNLTQKELAQLIGAKSNSISNWENNQNRPNGSTLLLLSRALDIPENDLLDDDNAELIEKKKERLNLFDYIVKDRTDKSHSGFNILSLLDKYVAVEGNYYNLEDVKRLFLMYLENPSSVNNNERTAIAKALVGYCVKDDLLNELILAYLGVNDEGKKYLLQSMEMVTAIYKDVEQVINLFNKADSWEVHTPGKDGMEIQEIPNPRKEGND